MDWGSGSNDHGEGKEGVDGGEIRNDPNGRRPVVASEPRFDRWVHPDVTDGVAVSQKSKPDRERGEICWGRRKGFHMASAAVARPDPTVLPRRPADAGFDAETRCEKP